MDKNYIEVWELMVEYGIATDEEIGLVVALNGRNVHTLNSIISVRTGYNDIDQYLEEEYEEE